MMKMRRRKIKDNPAQIAKLLEKGRIMTCHDRGVGLIWVSYDSLSRKKEEGDSEERSRVGRQESTVKRKKIEKVNVTMDLSSLRIKTL